MQEICYIYARSGWFLSGLGGRGSAEYAALGYIDVYHIIKISLQSIIVCMYICMYMNILYHFSDYFKRDSYLFSLTKKNSCFASISPGLDGDLRSDFSLVILLYCTVQYIRGKSETENYLPSTPRTRLSSHYPTSSGCFWWLIVGAYIIAFFPADVENIPPPPPPRGFRGWYSVPLPPRKPKRESEEEEEEEEERTGFFTKKV